MSEEKNHPDFFSEGKSPVPVPPVDDAWNLMRRKLDAQMPVTPGRRIGNGLREMSSRLRRIPKPSPWVLPGIILGGLALIVFYVFVIDKPKEQISGAARLDSAGIVSPSALPIIHSSDHRKDAGADSSAVDSIFMLIGDRSGSNFERIKNQNASRKINGVIQESPLSDNKGARNSVYHQHYFQKSYQSGNSYNNDLGWVASSNAQAIHKGRNTKNYPVLNKKAVTPLQYARINPDLASLSSPNTYGQYSLGEPLIGKDKKNWPILLPHSGEQIANSSSMGNPKSSGKNAGADKAHNMSIGMEIKKLFPIGSQDHSPYNIHAGENLITDYIPGIYFRYDFNRRLYLEAAFHYSSPQYVRTSEIESHSDSLAVPTGLYTTQKTTITLEKLYYADIPFSLHYTAFDHFSLGAGLQFSVLRNGVGMQETRFLGYGGTVPDSVVSHSALSLKDHQTAYNELKKLDWRILLDVNFQWRRFNIGARYQQGIMTYLKTSQVGSGTNEKNSAIGVYLQVDLWRKKQVESR